MAWERVIQVCRAVFLVSVAALSIGFVLIMMVMFGSPAWLDSSAATETVGASLMAGGGIGGGISAIFLRLGQTSAR